MLLLVFYTLWKKVKIAMNKDDVTNKALRNIILITYINLIIV